MTRVLHFSPATAAPSPETPPHRRIRQASKGLALLFGAIFLVYCVFAVVGVMAFLVPFAGEHLLIGPKGIVLMIGSAPAHRLAAPPAGYLAVANLPRLQRLIHIAVSPLVVLPGVMVFWNLRRLFGLYGRGVVFSEANARLIKHIGLWLVANALAPLLTTNILAVLHMQIDQNWFHADTIPKIILGGVVYVIGMVMEVGRQIEEEQGQFV